MHILSDVGTENTYNNNDIAVTCLDEASQLLERFDTTR